MFILNFFLDVEVTESGLECDTPCGQDGLNEGRYWCHTADPLDTWGYCEPKGVGK